MFYVSKIKMIILRIFYDLKLLNNFL